MIMVRHFQEEEALPALPDLPKAVKVASSYFILECEVALYVRIMCMKQTRVELAQRSHLHHSLVQQTSSPKVTLLKLVMRNGTLQYEKQAVNLMGRDEPGKRWLSMNIQKLWRPIVIWKVHLALL